MKDKYGTKIVEGSLLVTHEITGLVPGRCWLGIVVKELEGHLAFKSSNMMVRLWPHDSQHWQVVLPPEGYEVMPCAKD